MTTALNRIAFAALTLLAITAGSAAHAQATINQNKAQAGGVTPGDSAGFPVTLSAPGSYKLTGNLVVPAGVSGVEVTASGVTLDLNGFNITGPVVCVRNDATRVVTCTNELVAVGVDLQAAGNTLRNGQVRGFSIGVSVLAASQLEDLLVEHNHGHGIAGTNDLGARTLIRNVRSQLNGLRGFSVGDATIFGSTAASNGLDGIGAGRSLVLDSVSINNKGAGFDGASLALGRCVAQSNGGGNILNGTSLGGNLNGNAPF